MDFIIGWLFYSKCVSTRSKVFITVPFKGESRHAFDGGGFDCGDKGDIISGGKTNCTSCPSGTFGNKIESSCLPCPAGGFYQDKVGSVSDKAGGISCQTCNRGTYVPSGRGNSSESCQVCPEGTNKTRHAGFRACFCLDNYYRKDRFGKCLICPQDGVNCSGDIVQLQKGYYWHWTSSNIELYEKFKSNLQIFNDSYGRRISSFNASLPMIHRCPVKEICINNVSEVKGNCRKGHHGWMCTVCEDGYVKLVKFCKECSSPLMVFLDIVIFLAPLIISLGGNYIYCNQLTSLFLVHFNIITAAVVVTENISGATFVLISVLNTTFVLQVAGKPIRKFLQNYITTYSNFGHRSVTWRMQTNRVISGH
ncbi:hypothetical protein HOLleu_41983 [Holothuria leucospilota]|uniref:Tyrosine-protein kinase ephrin type A/B receptor-like domain-containing protein n=1 Tax=Holothuria leucospilota TaxID=206669 RepID=A0A9Q0YC92_HOLLE|nr:hypothetical protein HOLleu_41983 [Holothuria leucospilota]